MPETTTDRTVTQESLSVVVVAICSLSQLTRCLEALLAQDGAPAFETVVAADPQLGDVSGLSAKFPGVRMIQREGCGTPIELAAAGLRECNGERILLTEDSCVAHPAWVRSLFLTPWQERGAVGGVIEPRTDASPSAWAFCYVDFFRYMRPVTAGASPSLSVCNVAYHRSHLSAISGTWETAFLEPEIHGLLRERFGPLFITPDAEVRVSRNVRFADAVHERYAFGRLFGASRVASAPLSRRVFFAVSAPALPILLFTRMLAKALASGETTAMFVRAFPALIALLLAWSWGEWLGYLTQRRPASITTAREISLRAG